LLRSVNNVTTNKAKIQNNTSVTLRETMNAG